MRTETLDVEFMDESYEMEIGFYIEQHAPVICSVELLKETCKAGEVWYGGDGNPQWGPHWHRLDVMDLLSKQQVRGIAEALMKRNGKQIDEQAADRAEYFYQEYRETGQFHRLQPNSYAGSPM